MNDEILIIKKQLKDMAAIFNAVPEEGIEMPCIMPLLIVQRRMSDSTLKQELTVFTDICSKEEPLSCGDIVKASISLIRIQAIVERGSDEFDAFSSRNLIKKFKSQQSKAKNLIHLSKVNALTADEFQKLQIQKTLDKNEKLLIAIEEQIREVEKDIERNPLPDNSDADISKEVEKEKKKEQVSDSSVKKFIDKICGYISDHLWNKRNEEGLKDIEKEKSQTKLLEVPFYDTRLLYSEKMLCKDIPEFSILKRKNNVYFGLSDRVHPGFYDNSDESLLELTSVTEEFLQYMTQDILSGDYVIAEFTDREKEGLVLYLDFVSYCFERHIGKELNVKEYLSFKKYYTTIVRLMFDVERKSREDYYKAYEIADLYESYMKIYDLYSDDRDSVIQNILSDTASSYVDDIDLIMENHIVDPDARDDLLMLRSRITDFYKKESNEAQGDETKMIELETADDSKEDCQFVVQILDEDRQIVDEAVYAGNNIKKALSDFDSRDGVIKRLGVRKDGNDIFYEEKRR